MHRSHLGRTVPIRYSPWSELSRDVLVGRIAESVARSENGQRRATGWYRKSDGGADLVTDW